MKIKNFIDNQINAYQEPSREGTPKGEAIGLSRQKYEAALWIGLVNFKGPKIAKMIGISPGLLRNWKMEAAFKEAAVEAVRNFISTIIRRVSAGPVGNPGDQELYSNFLKREAESTINKRVNRISDVVLTDVVLQKDKLTESEKEELQGLVWAANFFFGINSVLFLKTRQLLIAKLASKTVLTEVDVKYMENSLGNPEGR